jgi:hypothetical protein
MTNYDQKSPQPLSLAVVSLFRHPASESLLPWWVVPAALSPLDFRGGGIGFAMLCRVKSRGEGSRGPAGGGVVGGEGLRVFQHWCRPSSHRALFIPAPVVTPR